MNHWKHILMKEKSEVIPCREDERPATDEELVKAYEAYRRREPILLAILLLIAILFFIAALVIGVVGFHALMPMPGLAISFLERLA